jgi:hypothetical protein
MALIVANGFICNRNRARPQRVGLRSVTKSLSSILPAAKSWSSLRFVNQSRSCIESWTSPKAFWNTWPLRSLSMLSFFAFAGVLVFLLLSSSFFKTSSSFIFQPPAALFLNPGCRIGISRCAVNNCCAAHLVWSKLNHVGSILTTTGSLPIGWPLPVSLPILSCPMKLRFLDSRRVMCVCASQNLDSSSVIPVEKVANSQDLPVGFFSSSVRGSIFSHHPPAIKLRWFSVCRIWISRRTFYPPLDCDLNSINV